jgi:hypothetical protein
MNPRGKRLASSCPGNALLRIGLTYSKFRVLFARSTWFHLLVGRPVSRLIVCYLTALGGISYQRYDNWVQTLIGAASSL